MSYKLYVTLFWETEEEDLPVQNKETLDDVFTSIKDVLQDNNNLTSITVHMVMP